MLNQHRDLSVAALCLVFAITVAGTAARTKADTAAAVPNLLAATDDSVVTGARPLVISAPEAGWDFSDWDSLLVKLRNESDRPVTVRAGVGVAAEPVPR